MDHHDDLVHRDVEEQMRLDDLEALVDQRRGVDGDDRSHRPRGVGHGLLDRDLGQLFAGPPAERAPAGGEHQAPDLAGAPAGQALGEGGVLGVHRHDLARGGGVLDQGSTDDQRLLVGQGKLVPCLQRSQRRLEAHGTGHPVEDHVTGPCGQGPGRLRAGQDLGPVALRGPPGEGGGEVTLAGLVGDGHQGNLERAGLISEELDVAPASPQRDNAEPVGVASDDVQRLGPDRPGAAEHDDVTACGGRGVGGHPPIVTDLCDRSTTSPGSARTLAERLHGGCGDRDECGIPVRGQPRATSQRRALPRSPGSSRSAHPRGRAPSGGCCPSVRRRSASRLQRSSHLRDRP